MIISASRRTDIPFYFSEWFFNRLKDGFCLVQNPFNKNQISFIDLSPKEVTAFVFWTRNPQPLLKYLDKIDEMGYKYYFQFTINNYPKSYELYNSSYENVINCFQRLSDKIGKGRVIWRYDPIILTKDLDYNFHIENFTKTCRNLFQFTKRVVVSVVDNYDKTVRNLNRNDVNYELYSEEMMRLLRGFANIANNYHLKIESCAEKDLQTIGILHTKCVDEELLKEEFGMDLKYKKDKNQRQLCGCMESKDIGMNDTCLMGCLYCYATINHKKAVDNRKLHDPEFPLLIKSELPISILEKIEIFKKQKYLNPNFQLDLF